MKRWGYWVILGGVLIAAIALVGWARTYVSPLIPRAAEEWSRGRVIGVTPVNVRVDAQVMPNGRICLTWVDLDNRIRVAQLGDRGQVVADRTPTLDVQAPYEPRLLLGPEGEIHLIWRETSDGRSLLNYAQLDSAVSVQVDPFLVSFPEDDVGFATMAFNRSGGVEIFWVGQAGVYNVTVSPAGEMLGEPILLAEGGEAFGLLDGDDGVFHLTWLQNLGTNVKGVYYVRFDPIRKELGQSEEMDRLFLQLGQSIQSLTIGTDDDTGYIVWIIQDMKYVTSSAHYAFFPLEIPRQKKVRDLQLEGGSNPLSVWAMPGQHGTALVALTETVMTSDGLQLQIGVMKLQGEGAKGDQAWVNFASRGGRVTSPVALRGLILSDMFDNLRLVQEGWPENQYIVTASDRPSLRPTLLADAHNNLHLVWLETGGFDTYRVTYASTATAVKEAYNRLTLWDVTDRALSVAMQLFMAVGLTPVLAIYWSLFPLMWLLLYLLFTGNEHLTVPSARVAFGIAVVLEVLFTYLIYPHRSMMPPGLQQTAPLLTAAVGLTSAMIYLWKRDERPLFGAFFVFAIIHGVLQVIGFVLVR